MTDNLERTTMNTVVIGNIELIDLLTKVDGLKLYKLAKEHIDDDFPQYPVPKDTVINGASVPKFLRDIISPTGELFRASAPHDYFYTTKVISRRKADAIFRKIVLDDTGDYILAYGAWLALRAWGWKAWRNAKQIEHPELLID